MASAADNISFSAALKETRETLPNLVSLDSEDKASHYSCVICCNVLSAPVLQMHCGHRACSSCIESLKQSNSPVKSCPGTDSECKEVDLEKDMYFPDFSVARELSKLKVYCTNKKYGCEAIMAWSNLDEHCKTCPFQLKKCKYCTKGCPEIFPQKFLASHEGSCMYNVYIPCPYCDEDILKVKMIEGHAARCMKNQYQCPLAAVGCNFIGVSQQALFKHSEEMSFQHLLLMKEWYNVMKQSFQENNKEVATAMEATNYIKRNVDEIAEGVKDFNGKLDERIRRVQQLESNYTDNMSDLLRLKEHFSDVGSMLAEMRIYEKRDNVEFGFENGAGANAGLSFHFHEGVLQRNIRGLIMSSSEGKFLWKIPNYRRIKSEATSREAPSVFSPSFYTAIPGYKMCLRLYPNGDGMGANTHVSIYIAIMKGECDTLLKWPFQHKVVISVLDQDTNNRNIIDAFRPDPTSNSFKRPSEEVNVASGFPLFAPQYQVEGGTYMRDDNLFIQVEIQLLPE